VTGSARIGAILLAVVGISAGQLLLKIAALRMVTPPGAPALGPHLLNAWLVAGIATLGLATLLWIWVLRTVPLNQAYPWMALCFVLVPVATYFVLGETMGWRQVAGTALIVAGVAIAGR
jgi:drug/metabolite transporter (DMT)-like permease